MAYRAVGATEGAAGGEPDKLDLILQNQALEAKRRKLTVTIGIVAAIIAAARLGIVAVPLVKAARARPRRVR